MCSVIYGISAQTNAVLMTAYSTERIRYTIKHKSLVFIKAKAPAAKGGLYLIASRESGNCLIHKWVICVVPQVYISDGEMCLSVTVW